MSKKITISVPDFLHNKIEMWRGSFNLSRLFQDAVSDAIKKKEEFTRQLKNDVNITEIVERLKKEKKESEERYFEDGEQSGIEWARRAHYRDLKIALHKSADELIKQGENFQNYFKTLMNHKKLQNLHDDDVKNYRRLFMDGWKRGVKEFWDSIKNKIGEV